MMIELLSPSHTERLSDYPVRAGVAGAFIAHRHRRTSIKQQGIYAAIRGKSGKFIGLTPYGK
jgi:hypothetical protein